MRKLARMAAIGGVGLLAITACGEDETAQGGEATQQEDTTEEAQGYSGVEDLDAADAQAFMGNYVVNLRGHEDRDPLDAVPHAIAQTGTGGSNEVNYSNVAADCEASGDVFTCEVVGTKAGNHIHQNVDVEFVAAESESEQMVDVRLHPGDITGVYSYSDRNQDTVDSYGHGVVDPEMDGEYALYPDVALEDFENPDATVPHDRDSR